MSRNKVVSLTLDQAEKIIIEPYITEKTFNLIEKENKLTFIVTEKATKKQIAEALVVLYESEATEVNTLRTIRGKKAVVKFMGSRGCTKPRYKVGPCVILITSESSYSVHGRFKSGIMGSECDIIGS